LVSGGGHRAKFTTVDHTPLNVGDNALLVAFLHQQPHVTPDIVTSAIADRLKNVGKLDKDGKPAKKKPLQTPVVTKEQEVVHESH